MGNDMGNAPDVQLSICLDATRLVCTMRKSSIYSARQSHAGSLSSQAANAQLKAKVLEKRKEHDALLALERMSAEYVRRLEAIDLDCNVMADAGKSVCPRCRV